MADYVARYQKTYENLFHQMQRRVDWAGRCWEMWRLSAVRMSPRPISPTDSGGAIAG